MKASDIHVVACVGAGTIGSSWATHFAWKGYHVDLYDLSDEILKGAMGLIRANLEVLAQAGAIPERDVLPAVHRVRTYTDLEAAVRDADFVVESGPETYAAKREIFRRIDIAVRPEVVIASSSSFLLMTQIQPAVQRPERCILAHPFNPPHIVPLVEVVKGRQTSDETAQLTRDLMTLTGKSPVIPKKEVPGYIANRLQSALMDEAFNLVLTGVASPAEVDLACRAGPGLRWALMGPFSVGMLSSPGGLRDALLGRKFAQDNSETGQKAEPGWTPEVEQALVKLVEEMERQFAGKDMADVRRWRDRKLLAILQAVGDP